MAWYVWVYIVGVVFYVIVGGKAVADTDIGNCEHPWFDILAPIVVALVWPIAFLWGIGLTWGKGGEK